MNRGHLLFLAFFTCIGLFSGCRNGEMANELPNVIIVLADDLGYGDVSCFNKSSKIQTPQLDQLASGGMMFTDAHSPSAVCTPARYGLLTGEYAWRTRLKKGVLWSWDEPLIRSDQETLGSVMQEAGYYTSCLGKWHLGLGWGRDSSGQIDMESPITGGPVELGFDDFFGITASLDIPPYVYIDQDRITAQSIDSIPESTGKEFWRKGPIGDDFAHIDVLPKLEEKACQQLRERSQSDAPFLMYLALPAPHTPILPTERYQGISKTNAYGDFVVMIDDLVGALIDTLEHLGLRDNTLFIFTSDNGASPMADFEELDSLGHHPSGIWRGHKADIYEGGHRVPFIANWPNEITPNSHCARTICLTDLMATVMDVVDANGNGGSYLDSYSLLPLFQGNDADYLRQQTIHHSIDGHFAIRQDDWKLIFAKGSGGWSYPTEGQAARMDLPSRQLYHLGRDPGETDNRIAVDTLIVSQLEQLVTPYMKGLIDPSYQQNK